MSLIRLSVRVVWCTQLTYQCVGMNDATSRDISTVLVFIVVFLVMLHVHCGVSESSRIQVNNRLSNNITDNGAP